MLDCCPRRGETPSFTGHLQFACLIRTLADCLCALKMGLSDTMAWWQADVMTIVCTARDVPSVAQYLCKKTQNNGGQLFRHPPGRDLPRPRGPRISVRGSRTSLLVSRHFCIGSVHTAVPLRVGTTPLYIDSSVINGNDVHRCVINDDESAAMRFCG